MDERKQKLIELMLARKAAEQGKPVEYDPSKDHEEYPEQKDEIAIDEKAKEAYIRDPRFRDFIDLSEEERRQFYPTNYEDLEELDKNRFDQESYPEIQKLIKHRIK